MKEVVITYSTSFKWVESPDHGNGGVDWVEVIIKLLELATLSNTRIFSRITSKDTSL